MNSNPFPQKNSILHRPIRSTAAKVHEESSSTQYEKEKAKLRAMQHKRQQLAQNRGVMMFGTKHDRTQLMYVMNIYYKCFREYQSVCTCGKILFVAKKNRK